MSQEFIPHALLQYSFRSRPYVFPCAALTDSSVWKYVSLGMKLYLFSCARISLKNILSISSTEDRISEDMSVFQPVLSALWALALSDFQSCPFARHHVYSIVLIFTIVLLTERNILIYQITRGKETHDYAS